MGKLPFPRPFSPNSYVTVSTRADCTFAGGALGGTIGVPTVIVPMAVQHHVNWGTIGTVDGEHSINSE